MKEPARSTGETGSRKAKKSQSEVAELLQSSAFELFAHQNYSSVRIKDIATATGLNSALIYYYFGSKEDLFVKVIETAVTNAFQKFDNVIGSDNGPKDILFLWIEIHISQFHLLQKLAKISLDYSSTNGRIPSIDKAIKTFYEKESVILKNTIKQGIAAGTFREVDPADMAMLISTFLDGVLFRNVMFPNFKYKQAIQVMRNFVFEQLEPRTV
jgi:AcrR family transcriptional regulator